MQLIQMLVDRILRNPRFTYWTAYCEPLPLRLLCDYGSSAIVRLVSG
jgi:hypothetical protein